MYTLYIESNYDNISIPFDTVRTVRVHLLLKV